VLDDIARALMGDPVFGCRASPAKTFILIVSDDIIRPAHIQIVESDLSRNKTRE